MMKKYARIEMGKMMELFSTDKDINTLFHPLVEWVEITDLQPAPQVGWLYVDGNFSEPEETSLL